MAEKIIDTTTTSMDIPPKEQRSDYLIPFIKPTLVGPEGGNFSLDKLLDAEATQAELDALQKQIIDNKTAQAETDRLQNTEIGKKADKADMDSAIAGKVAQATYDSDKATQLAKDKAQDKAISDETTARLNAYTYVRRNILTSEFPKLKEAIASGNPEEFGFNEGDYFTVNEYTYVLADYDHWYGYDYYALTAKRHWGVLVNTNKTHAWNSNGSTNGGYAGSELHAYLVNTVLPKIEADLTPLGLSLIANQRLYSTAMNPNGYDRFGTASGCASSWGWSTNQKISAPTEIEIYGSTAWSSSGYDTGEGCKPLKACQRFRFNELLPQKYFWLRDIVSASNACFATSRGYAANYPVTNADNVVGLIGIY